MIAIVLLVFASCCSNVVFLELLIRKDPGCGNLITFFQFLFVAVQGFIFTSNFGRKKSHVPFKNYINLVTMFFMVSVANNYALTFNIPMPLHMIFRSGSLVTNMFLGMIILKRRYSLNKYLSVLMITVGIFIATLASQQPKEKNDVNLTKLKLCPAQEPKIMEIMSNTQVSDEKRRKMENNHNVNSTVLELLNQENSHEQSAFFTLIGVFLLTFALFVSAALGIYQEIVYKKFGKHSLEVLFYSHALPLPGFLLLMNDIYIHTQTFSNSEPFSLPVIGNIPVMWLFLLCNIITQYICVRSVFTLSTSCSSLTVTLVITLRKFISLLFSVMYFKNPFTPTHWFATFLVFSGTLLFTEVTKLYKQKIKHS